MLTGNVTNELPKMLDGMQCFELIRNRRIDMEISIATMDLVMRSRETVKKAPDDEPAFQISMEWRDEEELQDGSKVKGYFLHLTAHSDPKYNDPATQEYWSFIVVNDLGLFESMHAIDFQQGTH